ncbi:MAG: LamG domain-containing protein [Deltaproteobacteria bacterium]|nr:LamG domain-containing protein [Deltaproteobacteria bacterium]
MHRALLLSLLLLGAPGCYEGLTAVHDGNLVTGSVDDTTGSDSSGRASTDTTDDGGPTIGCDPDDSDLRLCLEFEWVSGGVSPDGSANGNDATVINGLVTAGPWDQALEINAGSIVTAPCTSDCQTGQSVTLEAGIRLDVLPEGRTAVIDDDGQLGLFVTNTGTVSCMGMAGNAEGGLVEAGQWHHVACVYDGQMLRAYVDAVEVAGIPQSGPQPDDDGSAVGVGRDAPSGEDTLDGAIDQVRIWSSARTVDELSVSVP